MPFPALVYKESTLIYANNENILAVNVKVSWTGDKPQFLLTNQFGDVSQHFEQVALTTSGTSVTHTFGTTGQKLAWHIVFTSGQTTITEIELSGGVGMTAEGALTDLFLDINLDRTFNASPTRSQLSQLKIGEGQTSPAVTDTDLETPVPIAGEEIVDDTEALTGWSANGTNSVALNTSIKQRGTSGIDIIKSDTGSADASASKTVTSLDFTDKEFFIFVNVSASLLLDLAASPGTLNGAVVIRYGSDSSNYYEFALAVGSITAGRNVVRFTSSTATSTTGSPVIASMDYLFIGYETTNAGDTSSTGDFVFDDSFIASSDDFFGALQTGFPEVNFTSDTAKIQARVNTAQALGFLVGESGFVNADSPTELLGVHNKFDPESKGDTDEFIFTDFFQTQRVV